MKALVTGGGGFLGGALVRALVARGDKVVTFQRGDYPALKKLGVSCVQAAAIDFDSQHIWIEELTKAMRGCDVVFHTAAKAGIAGRYVEYENANEVYTQGVIRACTWAGVKRLVYTSTPSVVYAGRDEEGINESAPYPERFLAAYPRTKADAERRVLKANGAELATVALRPHLIWGPGDQHLVPRILDRARLGKLKFVGSGAGLVDSTYIDNAVHAHLLAAACLTRLPLREGRGEGKAHEDRAKAGSAIVAGDRSDQSTVADPADATLPQPLPKREGSEDTLATSCAGKAYFISNGEPLAMADLINRILAAAGLPPVAKQVSPRFAYAAGAVLETVYRVLRLRGEPVMTRFVAKQLSTAHWFDISAARRDLGYEPVVSIDEGMRRLAESLRAAT